VRLIKNTGNDRVVDELRTCLLTQSNLDIASPEFSLFAFAEVRTLFEKLAQCRLVLPSAKDSDLRLLGSESDRSFRNRLQARWLARTCCEWIQKNVEVRGAPSILPQSSIIANHPDSPQQRIVTGNCPFTTDGLGLTPGNQFSLIQCAEGPEESAMLEAWFSRQETRKNDGRVFFCKHPDSGCQSGSRGFFSPSPHTTRHAGPHRAVR
jgi:hypothetical protein